MTTELTKAAQQALKPHQIAQLVNKLRDIAREFHAHGCLRELISREVNSALTQRPAAQEARIREILAGIDTHDGDKAWWETSTGAEYGAQKLAELIAYVCQPAPQQATPTREAREAEQRARMQARLATRHEGKATADFDLPPPNDAIQQATPEPVPAEQAKWCEYVAGMVDCWVSAEWSNYHHMDEDRRVKAIAGIIERRLWALQKQAATPEPVGEVVAWVDRHDRTELYWRKPEQVDVRPLVYGDTRPAPAIDIKAAAGKLMGWSLPKDFSPDNGIRFTPPSFGWPTGTNLLNVQQAEQMLDYVLEGVARPAPGVPELLPAVLTDWGFDVHDDEEGRTWLTIRNPDDDVARMSVPTVWPLNGNQTIGAVVLHQFSAALSAALAAAQAKGADHG